MGMRLPVLPPPHQGGSSEGCLVWAPDAQVEVQPAEQHSQPPFLGLCPRPTLAPWGWQEGEFCSTDKKAHGMEGAVLPSNLLWGANCSLSRARPWSPSILSHPYALQVYR